MKFYNISLSILLFLLIVLISCFTSSKVKNKAKISLNSFKARPKIMRSGQMLKDPMRLFHLEEEKDLLVKVRFMWKTKGKSDSFALNKFDYKVLQITDTDITVYEVDQTIDRIDESTVNASKFLMDIKIANIDLPCNDHFYVCGLGEFIREYKKRLKTLDFTINPLVEDAMSTDMAKTQCLVLTIGYFESLKDVGYLCLDTLDDWVYFDNLITSRVIGKAREVYDGTINMINEVK